MVHSLNSMMRVMMVIILKKMVLMMMLCPKRPREAQRRTMKQRKEALRGPVRPREAQRRAEARPPRGPEEPIEDLRGSEKPRGAQRGRFKTKERVKMEEKGGSGGGHGKRCAENGVLSTFSRGGK